MPTKVITLPLSISNAYLLLGDRPVLVDAGAPEEETGSSPRYASTASRQRTARAEMGRSGWRPVPRHRRARRVGG